MDAKHTWALSAMRVPRCKHMMTTLAGSGAGGRGRLLTAAAARICVPLLRAHVRAGRVECSGLRVYDADNICTGGLDGVSETGSENGEW